MVNFSQVSSLGKHWLKLLSEFSSGEKIKKAQSENMVVPLRADLVREKSVIEIKEDNFISSSKTTTLIVKQHNRVIDRNQVGWTKAGISFSQNED